MGYNWILWASNEGFILLKAFEQDKNSCNALLHEEITLTLVNGMLT